MVTASMILSHRGPGNTRHNAAYIFYLVPVTAPRGRRTVDLTLPFMTYEPARMAATSAGAPLRRGTNVSNTEYAMKRSAADNLG